MDTHRLKIAGIHVEHSVTIQRPAEELFRFWRQLEQLPQFMPHLESVQRLDEERSHWVAKGPAGSRIEWDARVIHVEDSRLIAWESEEGAEIRNAGSVRFLPAPGGRGTEVHVTLRYDPPAGRLGSVVARLLGEEPSAQIAEDLRRFKQLMEAGEIATTQGQPSGRTVQRRRARADGLVDERVIEETARRARPRAPTGESNPPPRLPR